MELLFGIISGFMSSLGMRWRNNFNCFTYNNFRNRTTCSTRSKFNIFYSNMHYFNNSKFKK